MSRSATAQVGVQSAAVEGVRGASWLGVLPLAMPCGLLLAGGLVGYQFTLDAASARERLLGLALSAGLALLALPSLQRLARPAGVLVLVATLALLGGVWIIAASGPDVFRGTVGRALQVVFQPVLGRAHLTDPVEITNTRFIVGYNGLADLCLVAIFCCGGVLMTRRRRHSASTWALMAGVAVSLILLIGTGARGGLTGLAAGICLVAVVAWPRRYALLALLAAPLVIVVAALGILDKGLEFGSTAGRLTYWLDLGRLLVEYPLTGVGLGLDTANRVALQYEINPDPDRIFYAHNTFVQSYLELGPLGALGMLLVPLVAIAAALSARRGGIVAARRALLIAGLGVVGGLSAHGLTDQVVTTNVGTGLVLVGLAALLAALTPPALATLARGTRWVAYGLGGLALLLVAAMLVTPVGRAQALLDLGGLKLNQALALDPRASGRSAALVDVETILSLALAQDGGHPGVLRDLARVRSSRYDDSGALEALGLAAASPRLDAFDTLQIAHLYRDLGFAQQAFTWAVRAYTAWGRPPEDAVMQAYAQSTLAVLDDDRARTLATQAEAAMRARTFGEATALFEQALTFQPTSAYLQDRLGAAQRAVAKYGG